jgi:hypothetical protein
LGVTLAIAFVLLIDGSPAHDEDIDPLFWFVFIAVLGLLLLCVMLRLEKDEEQKALFVRVFFLAAWLLGVGMAGQVIWRFARAGRFW